MPPVGVILGARRAEPGVSRWGYPQVFCYDPERLTKRLIAQLESLGHKVILEELPQAA